MALLYFEPFDAYGTNAALYQATNPIQASAFPALVRNIGGALGRVSGSTFMIQTGFPGNRGIARFTNNTDTQTIKYISVLCDNNYTTPFEISAFNSGGLALFSVQIGTNGTTELRSSVNGTLLVTGSVLTFTRWNCLEVQSVISTTGSVQLKVNGQLHFSASNINTRPNLNGGTVITQLNVTQQQSLVGVDDLLVMNTLGTEWNAPIGNGNFVMMSYLPSGSGTYNEMTASGAPETFRAVNNVGFDDDTSFLIATTGSFPTRQTHTVRPLLSGSSGILPTSASIVGVVKTSRARITSVVASDLKHLIRTNATDATGSIPISSSTGYTSQFNGWALNPVTSASWTVAQINALEMGIRRDA